VVVPSMLSGTDVKILKNIFAKKFRENIGIFYSKQLNFENNLSQLWDLRKTQFFRRKLAKIAENCDHNIDPRNAEKNGFT
jgi:hypothetical protein